ncbi:MAG: hypothetical protein MRK01_05220 [Candidatus Scalindua sp.]|nr:hypothetical protein [Candidatus Scalindua sp.]
MQKKPSLVKISRPRYQDISLRKRLFRLIDNYKNRPIIWICGPAGAGKTTLVNSYIENCRIPALWYQIDCGDKDPATFFHYLGLAVKKASPYKRKPLTHLTPEYLKNIPTFTRRFFEGLYSRLQIPYLVVFDNFQEVPDDTLFHEVISDGLAVIPEGINVIVISRNEPPHALERMRANQLMGRISWDDLRLSLDEVKKIIQHKGLQKMSPQTIRQFHTDTEGWAAGLLLLLEKYKTERTRNHSFTNCNPDVTFGYFDSEIFQKTDRETQYFLMKTALLPTINPAMLKKLPDIEEGYNILTKLNKDNLFVEKKLSNRQIMFQYHAMFREFLLSRAKESFTPKQLCKLKQTVAIILEESRRIEDAAQLFIEIGDWDKLLSLINDNAEQLSLSGRIQTLLEWIKVFPQKILDDSPWLSYWLGECNLFFNPVDSIFYYERACRLFRDLKEIKGVVLSLCGILRAITYECRDYKQFDSWIAELDKFTHNEDILADRKIQGHLTSCIFPPLAQRLTDHPDFSLWKENAHKFLQKDFEIKHRAELNQHLAIHSLNIGDFASTTMAINSFRKMSNSNHENPLVAITGIVAESAYYFCRALHKECVKVVKTGLRITRDSGVHIWEGNLLGIVAASLLSMNDHEEAEKHLNNMAGVVTNNYDTSLYYLLTAWHALIKGDLSLAKYNMEKGHNIASELGAVFPEAVNNLGMAQVLYECGEKQRAYVHLSRAKKIGERMKSSIIKFSFFLMKAQFAFNQNEEQKGKEYLQIAMTIGRENGYFNFFFWRTEVMVQLCMKALEEGFEKDYVTELIRKGNLIPKLPPLEIEDWPWQLKIYTLGRFEILKDGKPICFSRKTPQKPLAMLKILIAFGGHRVSETRISDTLWPEAEGDAAHHAFTTTLSRLRNLIGIDDVITLQDGRLSINPRYCWIDVWACDRLFIQADEAARDEMNDTFVRIIVKSVGLLRGNFLAGDVEEPWTILTRERLRNKFVKYLIILGSYWENSGQIEKAIDCYNKGIEYDDLAEELYQNLMICYQTNSRNVEALGVYGRLKKVLSLTIDAHPSSKTEQIYKSLFSK